jgi:CubicO group peptidase (beta-lactamase class C family)
MRISADDLQSSLEASLTRHQVPGASVAVIHEGELTSAAAGVVNVNTDVELTPDTVMHIGSITKVFNATLVMQLFDEGKVDLDERVLRYLPELKLRDREALEQITVRMLLNHTSGIDGAMLPDHGHDEETIEKGIARFAELGQIFQPSTQYSYCNAATVIAGYLAQQLRRESWYRMVRERIFEPLQMEHAATLPEEALLHRASVGHYLNSTTKKLVRTSFAFMPLSLAPCGTTLMMSASDLIAFTSAHMGQGKGGNGARILSAPATAAMRQVTVDNRGKGYTYIDMGIGWFLSDDGLLMHGGGGPGIGSMLYAHPERGFAAAVLTNAEHGLSLINEFMEPWLSDLGTTKPLGMADIHLPSTPVKIDCDRYVGVYEDVSIRHHVSRQEDGLALSTQVKFAIYDSASRYASTERTPPVRLIPVGDEQFLLESVEETSSSASVTFARIVTFRDPDFEGNMRYLGNHMCLYRRVSQ